jgi:Zn-dependent metalloprotease
MQRTGRCYIVPPGLLEEIARTEAPEIVADALSTLARDRRFRVARAESVARMPATRPVTFNRLGGRPLRSVSDQKHLEIQTPGEIMRSEGAPAVPDDAVNQAYEGLGATYDFYWTHFGRDSLDGDGMALRSGVHFGRNYGNAFWDGSGVIYFGDGDGRAFLNMARGIDIIGHELTHGVIQAEANLSFSGQAGALNEGIADAFGIMIKQWAQGQTAADSDWLIGVDVVGPVIRPGALRSLKAPGTANVKDHQVARMDDYLPDGDVHMNSGIPGHAFYLTCLQAGGNSWDAVGRVWYAALRDNALNVNATFEEFAARTVRQAGELFGMNSDIVHAVRHGWEGVQVKT